MMRIFVLWGLVVLMPMAPAHGQAPMPAFTGRALLNQCEAGVREQSAENAVRFALCMGFVHGVTAGLSVLPNVVCLPEGENIRLMTQKFTAWLTQHPELQARPAGEAARAWVLGTYPCH
jgi:hypothetical protein